jgi:hypothetical protein
MKRDSLFLVFSVACLVSSGYVTVRSPFARDASCTPSTVSGPTLVQPTTAGCFGAYNCPAGSDLYVLQKSEKRTIRWPDGYSEDVTVNRRETVGNTIPTVARLLREEQMIV